jgi:hypothetical protein
MAMLGPKQEAQGALFYEFSIEDHVSQDHLLRSIDRFVDLSSIRDRVKGKFDMHPERIIADMAYGSGPMLGWLTGSQDRPAQPRH